MIKSNTVSLNLSDYNLERLMREVNILFLSDLHYDVKRKNSNGISALEINKLLVNSLEKRGSEWEPDILIIAGDLVNQGKENNYEYFFDLIDKLIHKFPNLRNAIFTTPGNHDINRENIVAIFKYLYSLRKEDPGFENLKSYTKSDIIDTLFSVTRYKLNDSAKQKLIKYLVEFEAEYFKTYIQKDKKLNNEFLNGINKKFPVKGLKTVYTKDILGVKLVSMNSSFFCNLDSTVNDRNNLFFIKDVVDETIKNIGEPNMPVITFMHHPFYYMHESEYIYPLSDGNDQENNNFNKIADKSDLILSGHVHGELHEPTVIHQKAYAITNGTSFTGDEWNNKCYPLTYALIKVNKQLNKFRLNRYKYSNNKFELLTNQSQEYYPFYYSSRLSNSLELEKVHLINYFMQLKPVEKKAKIKFEENLIRSQLKLYNKGFGNKNIRFGYKQYKGVSGYIRYMDYSVKVKEVIKKCFVINIETNPEEQSKLLVIRQLLSYFNTRKGTADFSVYFAINVNSAIALQGKIKLVQNVEPFIYRLKSFILSTKFPFIKLDFIYY